MNFHSNILMLMSFFLFFGTYLITMVRNSSEDPAILNATNAISNAHLKVVNNTFMDLGGLSTTVQKNTYDDIDPNLKVATTDAYEFNTDENCLDHEKILPLSSACSMLNDMKLKAIADVVPPSDVCQIHRELKDVNIKYLSNDYEDALKELKCITCLFNQLDRNPQHKGKLNEKCRNDIAYLNELNTISMCENYMKQYNKLVGYGQKQRCCQKIVKNLNHKDLVIKSLDLIHRDIKNVCRIGAYRGETENRVSADKTTTSKPVKEERLEDKVTDVETEASDEIILGNDAPPAPSYY